MLHNQHLILTEEMCTKMADEDYEQPYVYASLNTQAREDGQFKNADPFNKTWDELKDLT